MINIEISLYHLTILSHSELRMGLSTIAFEFIVDRKFHTRRLPIISQKY